MIVTRDKWPDFDPMEFDCDICNAKKGEYCDPEHKGIHAERAIDELQKVMIERKRFNAEKRRRAKKAKGK